jgi:hypothetical protein
VDDVADDFFRDVSRAELFKTIENMANMEPGSSTLVRQVEENAKDIKALRFYFYGLLAGVIGGVGAYVGIIQRGLG